MEIIRRGNIITFLDRAKNVYAYIDYDESLFELIKNSKWHVKWDKAKIRGYLNSSKLGYLHQVVMKHFYGIDEFNYFREKAFVIDHLDNDSFNNKIENLCYMPRNFNTAKGLTFDIERRKQASDIGLNVFKDYNTKKFQITIFFNKEVEFHHSDNRIKVSELRLVYENDYKLVIHDAEHILHSYEKYKKFELSKLNYINVQIKKAEYIKLEEGEANHSFVVRNGETYIIPSKNTIVNKINPNKDLY